MSNKDNHPSMVQCAVCKVRHLQEKTDLWVYHESFPGNGVVCRHHHGVMEEYNRLLEEASEKLNKLNSN